MFSGHRWDIDMNNTSLGHNGLISNFSNPRPLLRSPQYPTQCIARENISNLLCGVSLITLIHTGR